MLRLIVSRHGYTFGPDQIGGARVIMCGSGQNLPLVQRGRDKARLLAQTLMERSIQPAAFVANHLIRTWEHACILRETYWHRRNCDIPLHYNEDLLELDYGAWAGLCTEGNSPETNEVIARFGQQAWDDWQQRRLIPAGAPHNWQVTEQDILTCVQRFEQFIRQNFASGDTVVAVASQGSMTFLHSLCAGGMAAAIERGQLKTQPGNFCELHYDSGQWQLDSWDQDPGG